MKIIDKYLIFCVVIIAGLLTSACEDHQERFEPPAWLGGSNIEILESKEDYSIYLNLLKRAGFYKSVNTISYTLFAPDNDAFETYFEEKGIGVNFIDGKLDTIYMTDAEAYQLFSLHLLVNPRSRADLIYENAFGQIEDENYEYASLFFKKQTPSLEAVYNDFPRYHEVYFDSVPVYATAKYIPVWSKEYLEDVFSPLDGSDYEFLYPDSDYDSESELSYFAMNWGNGKILPDPDKPDQLGIKTSSGFIYPLDQVVRPLPTIEKHLLQNQDKYGVFYDLLQRFANYGNAKTVEVEIDGEIVVQQQYKKSYTNGIASIADERGPKNAPWAVFYMKDYFTAFIPEDAVMTNYLDTKILPTFGSIDSIPELTLSYLLRAHFINTLGLVSKMEQGIFDNFGTPIVISKDEIISANSTMCSNGGFYNLNKVMEPYAFTAITEDLFFNKDYSTFLVMLVDNNLLTDLITKGDEVTLFASTNDELLAANIRYDPADGKIYYFGIDDVWREMVQDDLMEFIQNHISYEQVSDLSGEGFIRMSSGNYVHYANGLIDGPKNQFIGETGQTTEIKETETGIMYHTDIPIKSRNYSIAKLLHNDLDIEYEQTLTDTTLTEFSDLLAGSRLLNYRIKDLATGEYLPLIPFLGYSNRWTVFAPTNDAMRQARAEGLIPSDRDSLAMWIHYHFIPNRVIFDDGNPDGLGTFDTYMELETIDDVTIYETIEVNNATNSLQVTDKTGQVVNVEHSMANMLAQKGVVHKINTVLKAW